MSEPTIPLVLTPEAEEDWEGFVHSPILLNKLGDGWVLHGSTFRKGYPVYAFTYGKSRIFREGKKWYMSLENDNFVKSLETKHIPGGDPNLPPTGVGWKWCDSQSMCLEGVAFRIAPSFELRLAREAKWSEGYHRRFHPRIREFVVWVLLCARRLSAYNKPENAQDRILDRNWPPVIRRQQIPSLPLEMWLEILYQIPVTEMAFGFITFEHEN